MAKTPSILQCEPAHFQTAVPLGDRCPSADPTDNPHSEEDQEAGPTDSPRPAPSDVSDPEETGPA